MVRNTIDYLQGRSSRLRDLAGCAFFAFAAVVTGVAAWEHPSILVWLYACHNLLLSWLYARRVPTKRYDRRGLWLGMIAAFLPVIPYSHAAPWYVLIPGLAGYGLCLWALATLGPRFGIAPADRGLTAKGPYQFLRHPMYLGELVFRLAVVLASSNLLLAGLLALVLAVLQIWRIRREEALIQGYACYCRIVRWRLLPGVW
jgi:hypothetical protein